jgi:hypothetical protein
MTNVLCGMEYAMRQTVEEVTSRKQTLHRTKSETSSLCKEKENEREGGVYVCVRMRV